MEGVSQFPSQQLLLQAAFERTFDAIAIIDNRDRLVEVNPAACELFAAAKNELLGNSLANWLDFPADDMARVRLQENPRIQSSSRGITQLPFTSPKRR